MGIIKKQDKSVIKAALGPNVEIVACTAARVYNNCMRPDRWTAQGHEGALVLLKDKQLGGLFLRLVNLKEHGKSVVVWEHEIYFDFEYRIDCDFFHSFESEQNVQIGLLFADQGEAGDFAQVVYQKSEILQISTSSTNNGSAHNASRRPSHRTSRDELPDRDDRNSREGSIKSSKSTEKSSGGFFSSLFGRRDRDHKKEGKSSTEELTADDVGDPTEFRHLAHIGFNSATGAFDVKNIPTEWKEIFQKAGVTKEQLENKETAGFIADFVKTNVNSTKSATTASTNPVATTTKPSKKGPPPPPPAKTFRSTPTNKPTINAPPSNRPNRSLEEETAPIAVVTPTISKTNNNNNSTSIAAPPVDAGRSQLLASIRGVDHGALRSVEKSTSAEPLTNNGSDTDQTDIMAGMLAKALAARNKKMAHSDSESGDEW